MCRKRSWRVTFRLLWRPMRSAWGSTRPTCGSWCTTTCRAVWRRITRRRVAPAATELPARCLLLYTPADRHIQEFFIENAYPSRATVARVYQYLCGLDEDPIEVTQQELKERLTLELGGEGSRGLRTTARAVRRDRAAGHAGEPRGGAH